MKYTECYFFSHNNLFLISFFLFSFYFFPFSLLGRNRRDGLREVGGAGSGTGGPRRPHPASGGAGADSELAEDLRPRRRQRSSMARRRQWRSSVARRRQRGARGRGGGSGGARGEEEAAAELGGEEEAAAELGG